MGDPHKMILLESLLSVIKEESLIDNMAKQGERLIKGLKEIQVSSCSFVFIMCLQSYWRFPCANLF